MIELLGKSVGDWSANENVNFDGGFSNADGSFFSSAYLYGTQRKARLKYGTTGFVNRKKLYIKFTDEMGLNEAQINEFWSKWLIKGKTKTDGFEDFVNDQILLQKSILITEQELLKEIKEEIKQEEISDLNLFPPKKEDTGLLTSETIPIIDKKSPNYLLYGLIGLGVILGAFLIFKKK